MENKINVLILGITGMLGNDVYQYFIKQPEFNVVGTIRTQMPNNIGNNIYFFEADKEIDSQFKIIFRDFIPDYIINCIGIINKFCHKEKSQEVMQALKVNSLFPHELNQYIKKSGMNTKIIQIATDCVFSGNAGDYDEGHPHDAWDIYGKTKSLGEVIDSNFLNIRCSIIGIGSKNKVSLLDWFLNHKKGDIITGFPHHKWNGVTTLQFAKFCSKIILINKFDILRKMNHVIHYCPNNSLNKYELLQMVQKIFRTEYIIIPDDKTILPKNMTLKSIFLKLDKTDIYDRIIEYKNFKFSS